MKVKKDWEIKKLGDICEFRRGLTYSKNDEVENSRNAVLRSNNIDLIANQLDLSEIKYISDKIKINETKKVKRNSLLICTANGSKAHLGKVALIDDDYDFAFGGFMGLLIPNENIYPRFFYYALISDNYKKFIKSLSDGANINNLKFQDLSKFEIPVPPLEEQKRIVKILDEKIAQLETIKTNAQTNLQNAKDLFQSQLAKAFSNTTWKKKRLGDSSELITKGSSPKWQGINYVTDDGILFVTSENVRENYIDLEKSKYLEKKFNDKQKRSILKKNDVLVNIVGASIGRAAIFDFDIVDANINQAVALIRSKNEIDVHFLSYFLNSDNAMNQYNNAKKDTARANLSLEDINNLRIPLPPLPEQKRIVKELDTLSEKVRQLQEIYTKQIANCDDLKQSLLQKVFEGEL